MRTRAARAVGVFNVGSECARAHARAQPFGVVPVHSARLLLLYIRFFLHFRRLFQGYRREAVQEMEKNRARFDKLRRYHNLGDLWELAKRVDELS